MARFDTKGLDGVLEEMKQEGELVGPAADAMLMAGAEQVKLAWERAAKERGLKYTGTMIGSIGYPDKPENADGVRSIDIYPQGTDNGGKHEKQPIRNATKAFYVNYKKGKGSGWIDEQADKYSEDMAIPAMIAAWENYKK